MVVACFLILNAVCELGNRMFSSQLMFGSDFFMPISLLASFGFSLLLLFLEKKWSCHASWPQFFFYFLLFVGTVPTFKVQLEKLADKPEVRFLNDYDNIYVQGAAFGRGKAFVDFKVRSSDYQPDYRAATVMAGT